VFEILGENKYI